MIWATWIAQGLSWLKTNWQGVVAGLVLGASLTALKGCQGSNTAIVDVSTGAAIAISGTARASSGGSVKIPGRPAAPCPPDKVCPECPSLEVNFGSDATVSGIGTGLVSSSAKVDLPKGRAFSLWAGGGVVLENWTELKAGYAQVGVQAGSFAIPLRYDSAQRFSLGLDYKFY